MLDDMTFPDSGGSRVCHRSARDKLAHGTDGKME
jgi:hypothetical protein